MKKKRFSDHIMPRRIVRNTFWMLVQSAVLYVLFKITAVIWRSVYYALPISRYIVFLLLVLLMAGFLSFWQSLRLSRDQSMRGDFLASAADGSYDHKAELRMLARCDELWNDTFVVGFLYLLFLIYALIRTFLNTMLNTYLTNEQAWSMFYQALWENIVLYVFFVGLYCVTHLYFTVRVHQKWNSDRLHTVEVPTAEKKPYM